MLLAIYAFMNNSFIYSILMQKTLQNLHGQTRVTIYHLEIPTQRSPSFISKDNLQQCYRLP